MIRIAQVMVIDEQGNPLGVMAPEEGRRIAGERGLDLVEVAPNARPPVCRIMDYGRYRYEQRKRTKKQHQTQTKILKLRPKTDPHDLETKLRHARRFLEGGDRVRFVVRMRGRERAVTERWVAQLTDLTSKLDDVGIVTGRPLLEGGGVTCTVEPKKIPVARDEAKVRSAHGTADEDLDDDLDDLDDDDDDDDDLDDDDNLDEDNDGDAAPKAEVADSDGETVPVKS